MFEVVVNANLNVRQGLKSPVRNSKGLPNVVPNEGFSVVLRVAIAFESSQVNDRGWFVDTDAVELIVNEWATYLASDSWTSLFDFRPTFERVSELTFRHLEKTIAQIAYVELDNVTLGVNTRYSHAHHS